MNDNIKDNSTDSKTNESETIFSNGIDSSMASINTGKEQCDQNHESRENKTQNKIEEENIDEFIRITAAHQTLIEAQTYDEQKNYPLALQLYRICVDFLLEELMFAEGTDQSRIYLREKCTAIMDRIDNLKTKLDPLPSSVVSEESTNNNLPIDQLEALNLV